MRMLVHKDIVAEGLGNKSEQYMVKHGKTCKVVDYEAANALSLASDYVRQYDEQDAEKIIERLKEMDKLIAKSEESTVAEVKGFHKGIQEAIVIITAFMAYEV